MGEATFTPVPNLDQIVAQMVADDLHKIAEEVAREAKRNAPPTKTWVSRRDGGVRRPHVHADFTEIPDNLRFKLTAFAWDIQHPGALPIKVHRGTGKGWDGPAAKLAPGHESYLRFPRDPSMGHYVQTVNCRCVVEMDPNGIAKLVKVAPTVVAGTKATATVYAEGEYVLGAEYGVNYTADSRSFPPEPTYFMRRTAQTMGARLTARR